MNCKFSITDEIQLVNLQTLHNNKGRIQNHIAEYGYIFIYSSCGSQGGPVKDDAEQVDLPVVEQISATYAARNFSNVRRKARNGPVIIASHNKDRQVLVDFDLFDRLSRNGPATGAAERINAKLAITLDSIDTYVCILDNQCRVKRMNDALIAALGRDESSLAGTPIGDIFSAPSFRYVIERVNEVLESQTAARFEQPSPMNAARVLSLRIKPWPGGVAIFADDVTEMTVSRENRARIAALRTALAAFGDMGHGTIDAASAIVDVTPSFEGLVAAPVDSLTGAKFVSLFAPTSRSAVEAAVRIASELQMLDVDLLVGGVRVQQAKLTLSAFWNGAAGHSHGFVVRTI